jgi:hypothetical protein
MKKLVNILNFLKLKFKSKLNVGLVVLLLVVIVGTVWAVPNLFFKDTKVVLPLEEIELSFDANGPYALLEPRRDGNAIILNIKRVAGVEKISYELAYQSSLSVEEQGQADELTSVERGVQGEINGVDSSKSEYSQEILFGTCSKGDTFSTLHCVFDKGVEFGTLTLRIYEKPTRESKTQKVYKFVTPWRMQKPDVALGKIFSADNHFGFSTTASRQDLSNVGYTIVHDLSGAPKLDGNLSFVGKVYALNVPTAKKFPSGSVTIEMAEDVAAGASIARYSVEKNNWELLNSQISKSTIKAEASEAGLFGVVVSQ